jgi:BTB/POZ domain
VGGQGNPEAQTNLTTEPFDIPDGNFIMRSSDNVNFRVHKSVLAMASPFFKDLLSLPQPLDSEFVDGLPMVQLHESSELIKCLLSILYPIPTVMPNSFEKVLFCFATCQWYNNQPFIYKVLYLLAACQKYDMVSVQSFIRTEVSRGASPGPKGAEALPAYAIASAKDLIPEMENAARMTLDHPMTFEILGEGLRLFEGWTLRDLVNYRKRCRDNLVMCLDSFLEALPFRWLNQLLLRKKNELRLETFTRSLDIHSRIRQEYAIALQNHEALSYCPEADKRRGSILCAVLENKLAQALDKVTYSFCFRVSRDLPLVGTQCSWLFSGFDQHRS